MLLCSFPAYTHIKFKSQDAVSHPGQDTVHVPPRTCTGANIFLVGRAVGVEIRPLMMLSSHVLWHGRA